MVIARAPAGGAPSSARAAPLPRASKRRESLLKPRPGAPPTPSFTSHSDVGKPTLQLFTSRGVLESVP